MIVRGIDDAKRLIAEELDRKTRACGLAVIRGLTEETPVDTGAACSNWLSDLNRFRRDVNTSSLDENGSYSQQQMGEALSRFRIGDAITISNNLPYIKFLNQGSSDKAGKFFVQGVIRRVEANARDL